LQWEERMKVHQGRDEQSLIDEHIDTNWGRADARLRRVGVSVWSLIGYLEVFNGDSAEARNAFALSPDEMNAALAYYRRNKKYIDARLLVNRD
jgi:uncharacterized protein (DUF433 family)